MKTRFLPELPGQGRLSALVPWTGSTPREGKDLVRPTTKLARAGRSRSSDRLALTEIRGSLTFTNDTVTAWFTLAEQIWPFRADADRESLIEAVATQYAMLAGANVHLRRVSVPFPIEQWAAALERNSTPLPATGDGEDMERVVPWAQHINQATARLAERDYSFGRTHIGVEFPRPTRMLGLGRSADIDEALIKRMVETSDVLGAGGMSARPATSAELSWLIYRSVGVGLTPPLHRPGDVGPDDIGEFAENIELRRSRFARTTELTDRRTGRTVHAAVLTVGRMEKLTIPQIHDPWAHLSEQLGFDVEWSSRFGLYAPAAVRGALERRLLMIIHQRRDFDEHGVHSPPELARLVERATHIGDEMDTGRPVDASRAHGFHRLVVHGDSVDECMDRVHALTRFYDSELHMNLVHPQAQLPLLRELIPGEPTIDTGYIRKLPVKLMAAAMPQATARVGDTRGDLIGHTAAGGNNPVFYDPHFATEVRERSGLSVFVSDPGGGKSTLMGALGYLNARRGVQVTIMDPSGPLARLCQMPELRRHARVVDLVGSRPGTLAPYAMIPTPRRAEFPPGPTGDMEHRNAIALAEAERLELVTDITKMLLPAEVAADAQVVVALYEAIREVPKAETSTLEDVIGQLYKHGTPAAKTAAGMLLDKSQLPLAQLFFGHPEPGALGTDAALTVITMQGLQLPDLSIDRRYWSLQEAIAVPMLHVAHRLAVRRAYSGDMKSRKFVGLDEAHILAGWGSGRHFLNRLARDSRKWNIAALIASQDPKDILTLAMQNLVSTVFVGRCAEDAEVAAGALRLLRLPEHDGYESTLAGLSALYDTASNDRLGYREFVMRDVDGRVQKIRIDVSYVGGLLEHLDTTPGGKP
jgi:hypothetical protein